MCINSFIIIGFSRMKLIINLSKRKCNYELISKFGGSLFTAPIEYSPFDVVGWSGRYHPCKYNLLNFMALGSVTWDHVDPSLQTVLTCPIDPANSASACDIVCFRSR